MATRVNYFPVVIKFHDQDNLQEKVLVWAYRGEELHHIGEAWQKAAGMEAKVGGCELTYSCRKLREQTGSGVRLHALKASTQRSA